MHQNRASPFASDSYRRRGYRRKFRSEDHFCPFFSQKKSRVASDFLCRGNRASWRLEKSRDFWGSGKNRRRSRRESRDFGALRSGTVKVPQRTCVTKIMPNFRGNFLVRLPQSPCFIGKCPRIVQIILWCCSCDFSALGFFLWHLQ